MKKIKSGISWLTKRIIEASCKTDPDLTILRSTYNGWMLWMTNMSSWGCGLAIIIVMPSTLKLLESIDIHGITLGSKQLRRKRQKYVL